MTTTATRPGGGEERAAISARTLRTDRWWLAPLVTFIGLGAWVTYATVRVFMHKWFWVEEFHYLTPFYSPCLTDRCGDAAMFGTPLPNFFLIPEAAFTLPFLLLFRLTCYYYRKAYYRAFWLSPPACAVPDGHKSYSGETRFPLIFQNAHRYAFYAAMVISVINTWDAVLAQSTGLGLGNVILWVNVIMLWAYTLSCHSCRHIAGGRLKHFSKHPVRYRFWTFVSKLNTRHMQLAWITLGTLALTDFYIMGLAAEWFSDLRIIN
ncbi:hypothetical protein FHR83_004992 [Actinoplanes campanulatus]|uniref:Uncharacterized protein n=1 Tax=Actinoplanes campanulatus TaxID=113559 RepID=A0A7W5FGC6_9ACTN|nr:hypothetical protein [Actinoplanes campanulatus]MBB3097317.1 hypothetical protein [Actinoplanes campanulatus]GGN17228.1 hypothetical protein GCM10010109_29760 [Actinoplanes campanulatus]GID37500.1 hypothetical protein Aca09nite_40060 [Actinoplanes campanulatus]